MTPEQLAKIGTELAHQQALFCWSALIKNQIPELSFLFAIPNGEQRSKITGARLKAAGVRPGVPDICLPVRRGKYGGLWIELKKANTSKTSEDQDKWIDFLLCQGYSVHVCYGWEHARDAVLKYLNGDN